MPGGWEGPNVSAYRALFASCPDGVLFTEPATGRILAANLAACELFAGGEEALTTRFRDELVSPADWDRWTAALAEREARGAVRIELTLRRLDGTTFAGDVTSTLFSEPAGTEWGWLIVRDVSERAAAEAALRVSEERFRQLIESSTEAFVAGDLAGRITEWNRQAEVLFGWTRREVLGRLLVETMMAPDQGQDVPASMTGLGSTAAQRLEIEARRRDGSVFPAEMVVWPIGTGEDRYGFNALLHDISERRQLEDELWELALVDDLTGLHNRRGFTVLARQAIREVNRAGRPIIGLFVDVDGLKAINDRHGHRAGDEALRLVAHSLTVASRFSDIVGRLSGDEFALLLIDAGDGADVAERVRGTLAEVAVDLPYRLEVSIGLARCDPDPECHLEDLFAAADRAMYQQKAARRRGGTGTSSPGE
jgi:diguanylate cyclase (GGDEF)-like protein/PAS domain S-box-containing protein